jgi:hypothetical protein
MLAKDWKNVGEHWAIPLLLLLLVALLLALAFLSPDVPFSSSVVKGKVCTTTNS